MGAILTFPTGKKINVRHIGYVFSRWQEVDHFIVSESDMPFTGCQLEVMFTDRRRLSIYYDSLAAVWDILHQPLFGGLVVYWFGRGYEIRMKTAFPFPTLVNKARIH